MIVAVVRLVLLYDCGSREVRSNVLLRNPVFSVTSLQEVISFFIRSSKHFQISFLYYYKIIEKYCCYSNISLYGKVKKYKRYSKQEREAYYIEGILALTLLRTLPFFVDAKFAD